MAVKVHGNPMSTATRRVLAAAYEKDLEVELVPVDMASGAHKKQPFLSLNPFGQVPAFEDGDVKLFGKELDVESRAITRYIAHKYENKGTPLLVTEINLFPVLAVWTEVEAHQFDQPSGKLAWELLYKKKFGMEIDQAAVEENETKLAKILDVYEVHLSKSKYLVGDSFTLADLHHQPCIHYLMATQVKKLFDERPHVCAWVKEILARPAWAKVTAAEKQG